MKIITQGLANGQMIVTKGYGGFTYSGEQIDLESQLTTEVNLRSRIDTSDLEMESPIITEANHRSRIDIG